MNFLIKPALLLLIASSQAQKAVDYILEHQIHPNHAASTALIIPMAEAA